MTGTPIKPELLAPAGDRACVKAAIDAGADAIYIGIGTFNMRQAVDDKITYEMLPEIVAQCHDAAVKLYLTVNTIIYPGEEDELGRCLTLAKEAGIDAVICSDWAVITRCKALGIPVHISTQMSCSNVTTAKFLASQGAERVVLARECTLEEIATITRESGVEVEVFVHGAQCVAISGRCFLSHLAYGCSANRGACRQPCRREYKITEVEGNEGADAEFIMGRNYILSAKDLCALPHLPDLVAAGIASFKVEGRARNPEYVLTVVSAYRQAIDAICAGSYTEALQQTLIDQVSTVYHRPFASGMMLGRPGEEQFTDDDDNHATEQKVYIGIVRNYYQKPQVVELLMHDHDLKPGERIAFHGEKTGVLEILAPELQRDGQILDHVSRGEWTTFVSPQRVRVNDKVYKIVPKGGGAS